ncbi:MAG: Hsp20/alpha crystallin family protein [bacterium]|nr:Hsp20/alpha crystallin family protein [bacterium]
MIKRRGVWDEMRRMQQQMDSLFETFFSQEPFGNDRPLLGGPSGTEIVKSNYRQALADVSETDKELIATVELPGVEKQDIRINATDDGIEIRVEKKDERKEEDKKKGIYSLERTYSGFYRFIPAPDGIDVENIKASYKNGVLELRIPKVESKKKAKQIPVE